MMKKLLIIGLLLIPLVLTSCNINLEDVNEQPKTEEPTAEIIPQVSQPVKGGTLKLAMRIPKTLNPILNEDITVDSILKLVFEPLFVLDETHKPVPNLAEDVEFSSDGLRAVITLKNNMFWSDGEAITANDLFYTLAEIERASESSIYKNVVNNIATYSKLDNNSVLITFKSANYGSNYSFCFPVLPEHHYTQANNDMNPLGSGLFKFVSYTNVKQLELVSTTSCLNKTPYIEKIIALVTPNTEADLYSFDQNIIDIVSSSIPDWGKYRSSKINNEKEYITMYYDFVGFNLNNPNFSNKKVREAVAQAINIDEIIRNIYLRHAVPTNAPVNPNSWVYDATIQNLVFDLGNAKKILSEEGYRDADNNGFLDKENNGVELDTSFEILVNEENEERVKIANLLNTNLEKIGFNSEVVSVNFDEYESKLSAKDFDMFVGGFNLSPYPELAYFFGSWNIGQGSNYFSYSDETMDNLLRQASAATDETVFKESLIQIQKQIAHDLPCISLAFRKSAVLTDKRIYGEVKPVINNIYSNIHELFIAN